MVRGSRSGPKADTRLSLLNESSCLQRYGSDVVLAVNERKALLSYARSA
jgi:hypothetical protein